MIMSIKRYIPPVFRNKTTFQNFLTLAISFVWLVNGLYCKLLNGVPRHRAIVGQILGADYATLLTQLIGISEIIMVFWIISGIRSRLCTGSQIVIVAVMNIIEFFTVPDMLLFGRWNILVAAGFLSVVYYREFISHKSSLR